MAFFGTPELAVPTLLRLASGRHEVVVAVTQPDRGRGRGRRTTPSPVALAAERAGIPLVRAPSVGDDDCVARLAAARPDVGVVVAFGQFLPRRVRELPTRGYLVNAHASLLPKYRGAAPIAHAILDGETRTGVSVMRVEREMDAGPVMLVREVEIGADENAGELAARLARVAADAIADAIDRIADGTAQWQPQDASAATYAPKISRADARLDWTEPAVALARRVRAMAPAPGAFTLLDGDPLRILAAEARPNERTGRAPGTVVLTSELAVSTGTGCLVPRILQRPGGRPLDAAAFLRGRPIPDGTLLGSS